MLVVQLTKRTGGRKGNLVPVQNTFHVGHDSFARSSERGGVLGSLCGNV